MAARGRDAIIRNVQPADGRLGKFARGDDAQSIGEAVEDVEVVEFKAGDRVVLQTKLEGGAPFVGVVVAPAADQSRLVNEEAIKLSVADPLGGVQPGHVAAGAGQVTGRQVAPDEEVGGALRQVSGAAGLIFAGGIEASAVDAPTDFLFEAGGDSVGNVLNGGGGKAEGTGKPG